MREIDLVWILCRIYFTCLNWQFDLIPCTNENQIYRPFRKYVPSNSEKVSEHQSTPNSLRTFVLLELTETPVACATRVGTFVKIAPPVLSVLSNKTIHIWRFRDIDHVRTWLPSKFSSSCFFHFPPQHNNVFEMNSIKLWRETRVSPTTPTGAETTAHTEGQVTSYELQLTS